MIKIYHKTQKAKELIVSEEFIPNSWVHVENPTAAETTRLVEEFGLEESLLQDAKDIDEVPRYDIEDGIFYIFTRFAYSDEEIIDTIPLLIVVTKNSIVTISYKSFPRMQYFLNGKIDFNTTQRLILLSKILHQVNETYTQYLNSVSKKLRTFSVRVERIKNRDIIQFVNTENVLHDFNSSLLRMEAIYNSILGGKLIKVDELERDLIEDVSLASHQLVEITRENLRMIVNIRDAHSTIMTNSLNRVIKLFTSLTVILTIPTIMGTFYGMNVPLPFSDSPIAFFIIVLSTALVSLISLIIFFKKDWL